MFLHTIKDLIKNKQEEVVRKLIHVTKPGRPVIIVYSNPRSITRSSLVEKVKNVLKWVLRNKLKTKQGPTIYFYAHPLDWWQRFSDIAEVKIIPWRSFDARTQKLLIPNNRIGKKMFAVLHALEEQFPDYFVRYFSYPMIILSKNESE